VYQIRSFYIQPYPKVIEFENGSRDTAGVNFTSGKRAWNR